VLDKALEFDEWAMSLIVGIVLLINLNGPREERSASREYFPIPCKQIP
jgi:hypothetical protein